MSSLASRRPPRPVGSPARRALALSAVAAACILDAAGCRRGDGSGAGAAEVTEGPPAFEPGPLQEFTFQALRLRFRAPENLSAAVDGDVVTLTAVGFPPVAIRVERSGRSTGSGGGGACRDGECSFEREAPCRRLTCTASGAGDFVTVIPAICGSLESTFVPAGIPVVRALSTGGTHADCDETQLANSQSLDPKIAELLPAIDDCWSEHADDDPDWRAGEATVRLERAIRDDGRASYDLTAVLSGLEGDSKALQACLDEAVAPLRGHLPVIGNAVCAFRWDHRFALARQPSCEREASPPSAAGPEADAATDGAGETSGPGRAATDQRPRTTEPAAPDARSGPESDLAPEDASSPLDEPDGAAVEDAAEEQAADDGGTTADDAGTPAAPLDAARDAAETTTGNSEPSDAARAPGPPAAAASPEPPAADPVEGPGRTME